jgi:hypothetical protein
MANRRMVRGWNRNLLLRKSISVVLMTSLAATFCWAKGPGKGKPDVHQQVTALGIGSKVSVDLTDGSTRSGTIKSAEEQSFTLDSGSKKGTSTIPYASVTSLHKGGLSKGGKIGLLVAVVVVVVVVAALAVRFAAPSFH